MTGALTLEGLKAEIKQLPPARQWALYQLDADNFKSVNDELGHAAGDEVLKDLVQVLTNVVRTGGMVCRLHGEEMVLVEPRSKSSLSSQARRLHKKVVVVRRGRKRSSAPQSVTVSMGAVELSTAQLRRGLEGHLKRADALAIQAKCLHKNRVETVLMEEGMDGWHEPCSHSSHIYTHGQHIQDGIPKRRG